MYPKTGEWIELGVVFLMGPLHVLACLVFTAIAWWRAPGLTARVTVLATNAGLACAPVLMGLSVGTENPSIHQFGLGLAACELVAVSGLAAVLIFRRAAVAPQR